MVSRSSSRAAPFVAIHRAGRRCPWIQPHSGIQKMRRFRDSMVTRTAAWLGPKWRCRVHDKGRCYADRRRSAGAMQRNGRRHQAGTPEAIQRSLPAPSDRRWRGRAAGPAGRQGSGQARMSMEQSKGGWGYLFAVRRLRPKSDDSLGLAERRRFPGDEEERDAQRP